MSPSDLHPTPVASEAPLDPKDTREHSVEIPVLRVLQSRVTGALRPENSLGSEGGLGEGVVMKCEWLYCEPVYAFVSPGLNHSLLHPFIGSSLGQLKLFCFF